MMIIKRLLIFFLLSIFSVVLFCSPVLAVSEFETSYQIDYKVYQNGLVNVDQQVKLTNRLAKVYATEYSMTIGSNNLSGLKAWDEFGPLEPKVKVKDNHTLITLNFKEKVIGKGKGRTFHLVYQSPDFALIKGKVLEVGIPLLAETEDLINYQVALHIPASYGQATYILPQPQTVSEGGGFRHYQFSKSNLKAKQGINATFGEFQIFDFSLKYHLFNDQSRPIRTEIALPPDSPFQKIALAKLEPLPEKIEIDQDGNWLAVYLLEAKEELEVLAEGQAKLFINPQPDFPSFPLSQELENQYLKPQKYWPVNQADIQGRAEKLGSPEAIYQFLVNNFSYNYQRLDSETQRQGAVWALNNPQNLICMEFTDLFVALSRTLGIPAREVNGYAFTTNSRLRPLSLEQDVLHAWAEYYDQERQIWVPIDPTWGNTTGGLDFFHKLDLDHLVFVFRGLSSQYPFPAGSYKLDHSQGKDITVSFGDSFDYTHQAEIKIDFPHQGLAGLPLNGEIELKNTGSLAFYQQPLKLTYFQKDKKIKTYEIPFKIMPPYAIRKIPLSFASSWQGQQENHQLVIEFADQKVVHQLVIKPIITPEVTWAISGLVGLLIFLMINKLIIKLILTKRAKND